MPVSSVESLKEFIGQASVTDALLERVLASAARNVAADGVSETHEAFAELQEYYAAGILETSGQIQGALVSKSVADVSEAYATPTLASENGYFALYRRELKRITGKKGFIV